MDCSSLSGTPGIVALGLELDEFSTASPDSEFGQAAVALFTGVIENAMGTQVFANCFNEVNIPGEAPELWLSFELTGSAVAGSLDAISSELTSRGIPVNASPSIFGIQGGTIGYLAFESLPSIDPEVGGVLYLVSPRVFVVVGTEFADPSALFPTPTSVIDFSVPTSTPAAVSVTGVVADVEAALRPWLEQVTLTRLTLTRNDTGSIGSDITTTLVYTGDSAPVPDVAKLQMGIVDFSGMLDGGVSLEGVISVVFSDARVGGQLVSGTITITDVVTIFLLIDS